MKNKELQTIGIINDENFGYISRTFLQPLVRTTQKMAQIKLAIILADLLGFSTFILGWIVNMDNVKSAVVFIVGLIYAMVRVYFTVVHNKNRKKREEWDQYVKEHEWRKQNNSSN